MNITNTNLTNEGNYFYNSFNEFNNNNNNINNINYDTNVKNNHLFKISQSPIKKIGNSHKK